LRKEYTLSVFSENRTGLLARVVTTITRRKVNIDSLTVSKSSMPGIHRFTIVVTVEEEVIPKIAAQIEKQVDVLKAFYYETDEIVHQELALYKIPTKIFFDGESVETLVRHYNARILAIEPEYIVIEKTGHPEETEKLLVEFQKLGIYEFVRSGRVAITKPMEQLNAYLKEVDRIAKAS